MKSSGNKVLVTGVSGFVGKAVVHDLLKAGWYIVAAVRRVQDKEKFGIVDERLSWLIVGNINANTEWISNLYGVETVVHCAGRAHIMQKSEENAISAYREANVTSTLRLAQQAAAAGVRRFIFLSSIKVSGEISAPGEALTEANAFAPQDAYAQSKVEAEKGLIAISETTKMEIVIIRPPLVVGPGVKGNLASVLRWVQIGVPLPLGAVHNLRSFVALDNLVSLVGLCVDHKKSPQAGNQVFVVADGEDLSTTMLLQKIAIAAGRPSRLIPVPTIFISMFARILGNKSLSTRLLGNLQVDDSKVRTLLGWRPVVTLDKQLLSMMEEYKRRSGL